MKLTTREITRVGVFAAMHIAAAMVLRLGGEVVVPFSLVPFMAFLAAFVLGGSRGALSLVVYTILGLMGVPVFARPPYGGITYAFQPTFGFILGFIAAAAVAGRCNIATRRGAITAVLLAIVVLYAVGLPYFYAVFTLYLGRSVTWGWVFNVAVVPYIGSDLIKALLAVLLGRRLREHLR